MPELSLAEQTLIQEAASFATSTYDNSVPSNLSGSWEVLGDPISDPNSGYEATVYINRTDKRIYYANTGTNDFLDVGSWPDAYFGANSDQYSFLLQKSAELNNRVQVGGDLEGFTILTAGHSLGELLSQVQSHVFGWTGVGFDGPGAQPIINDADFAQLLTNEGITPVGGSNFISMTTEGVGIFGGGVVGLTGEDIEGVRVGYVALDSSVASGVFNALLTLYSANPGVGYLIGKLLTGAAIHDMDGINEGVQARNISINPDGGVTLDNLQNFIIRDPDGNQITLRTDADGNVALDADGNPIYEITVINSEGEAHVIEFDYTGKPLNGPAGLRRLLME